MPPRKPNGRRGPAPKAEAPAPIDGAFSAPCRAWFTEAFGAPTAVQAEGWRHVAAGEHALLLAPTGSGKTLAAFFWAIDRLLRLPADAPPGVRVIYISPLKALVTDIERNLRAPLVGVMRHAARLGMQPREVRVGMRTGDTPAKERAALRRHPPEILVTTPESLYLLLGSQAAEALTHVHTVIVDEVHALAGSKRGAHLALSLERLEQQCAAPPQRLGLSATVRPHDEAARFLAGARPVAVVDRSARPRLTVSVQVPVPDMNALPPPPMPPQAPGDAEPPPDAAGEGADAGGSILGQIARAERAAQGHTAGRDMQGLWAHIYPRLLELLRAHRTTLIFVNSRSLCERLAARLNVLAGEAWVRAHHGSVSLRRRSEIEEALKAGELRGIVATSSLELGIDMGSIELVVLVESPGSVARGLQRIGRAGHGVGQVSQGIVFPKHPTDLLECAVLAGRMREGTIEPTLVPQNPLDVLAQQLVALCVPRAWKVAELHALVRRSYPFHRLTLEALHATLDMLSGAYPSDEFAELRPLLVWDRAKDEVSGRKAARLTAQLNAGTIPDRGAFPVFLAGEGPRVGELDEEMVHESRKGDVFTLGASSWRIEHIGRDRVSVTPAPGESGRLPFWRGEGPGRPIELGRALGAMVRRLEAASAKGFGQVVKDELGLDAMAEENLRRLFDEQRAATGVVPCDQQLVVERFRDEVGDWRICILSPFGSRVHAPWALALEAALAQRLGHPVQTLYNDDGIAVRLPHGCEEVELSALLPAPEDVEGQVVDELGRSALFAGAFRENAARALLLPRRRAQGRAPLWQQRLRSKTLLAAAERYPSFPIVLETYRQCLRDNFDVPALVALLEAVRRREVRVVEVQTQVASPFARSLAFAYVAAYLYEGDAPLAERRAQALLLDRTMLRSLLGDIDTRSLLDQAAIDEVEAELQRLHPERAARDADGLHDMLRLLGDMTVEELVARSRPQAMQKEQTGAPPETLGPMPAAEVRQHVQHWLQTLVDQRRAFAATLAGERRYVAVEHAATLRDALGVVLPSEVPARFTAAQATPALEALVGRYARTHVPFAPNALAQRYGLAASSLQPVLTRLAHAGTLVHGELLPHGQAAEWCDAEVLRRLKRRTLSRLRGEVAAVPAEALGRFLPSWHGVDAPRRGLDGLQAVLHQLAGLPLSFAAWCNEVLPARLIDFSLDLLDLACATGAVVWVGAGSLGSRDGRVAFYGRAQAKALLAPPPAPTEPTPLHLAILGHLSSRGAAFTVELQEAVAGPGQGGALQEALWDLVWSGHVTNDTVQPLRALGGRRQDLRAVGGRWSSVVNLGARPAPGADAPSVALVEAEATARSHARAVGMLERYGVACREAAAFEEVPGGFTPLYQVLKVMEESGKVRRGMFVDGLGGAQFAYAGAIERLRAGMRAAEGREEAPLVLGAVDPANPFGSLLPWPERLVPQAGAKPRRVAGARVISRGGTPLGYLEANGQALHLFAACATQPGGFAALVAGLSQLGRTAKGRSLRLQRVDGVPALQHPNLAQLTHGGLNATYDGLMLAGGV